MKRRIDKEIEEKLTSSSLWMDNVKNDCLNNEVFFTLRDNRIDLYHKGGKLFSFDKNGFKTHFKYASVIDAYMDQAYLTESGMSSYKLITDFKSNYDRIKENCKNYSGVEAEGVSEIYHKNSYLSDSNVVILDQEISFDSLAEDKKQDRIDLLLLNKKTKTLKFVEVKHYSNKEIWSTGNPKVVTQIKRYEDQIRDKKNDILNQYCKYIDVLNRIFGLSLPYPTAIEDKVTLLIFNYDSDQLSGRFKKLIKQNKAFEGVVVYSKGDIKSLELNSLWKAKAL